MLAGAPNIFAGACELDEAGAVCPKMLFWVAGVLEAPKLFAADEAPPPKLNVVGAAVEVNEKPEEAAAVVVAENENPVAGAVDAENEKPVDGAGAVVVDAKLNPPAGLFCETNIFPDKLAAVAVAVDGLKIPDEGRDGMDGKEAVLPKAGGCCVLAGATLEATD